MDLARSEGYGYRQYTPQLKPDVGAGKLINTPRVVVHIGVLGNWSGHGGRHLQSGRGPGDTDASRMVVYADTIEGAVPVD